MRRVDASLIADVLAELSTRWARASDVDFGWLAWALRELQRDPQLSRHLDCLRRLPIVPLLDGGLGQPDGGDIHEPADGALADDLHAALGGTGLAQSLRLVHPSLLQALHARRASSILPRLKVQRLDRAALVRRHVVPALASTAAPSELPALLAFARRQVAHCPELGGGGLEKALRAAGARLLTSSGETVSLGPAPPALHVTLEMWPADLKCFVPQPPPAAYATVSDAYLRSDGDPAGWRAFFSALGVGWFPVVVPRAASPGDWESPALEAVLAALVDAHDAPRLGAFARAVVDRWQQAGASTPRGLRGVCVVAGDPSTLAINPQAPLTSFLTSLRSHAWLPGTDGGLHRPAEMWADRGGSSELQLMLGEHVAFPALPLPAELIATLGLQTQPTARLLIELLDTWSAAPGFRTSVDQMTRLLHALCGLAEASDEVVAELTARRCLWVPDLSQAALGLSGGAKRATFAARTAAPAAGRSRIVSGRFYTPEQVAEP